MTAAQAIKEQIAVNMQTLVANGVINSFTWLDQTPNALTDTPPSGYPFAIVGMPSRKSDLEDNVSNLITYRWDILVVFSQGALPDASLSVEGVMDNLANLFDTNFSLGGTAIAAQVPPIEVNPLPLSTPDKTFVCFVATLTARTIYVLGT